MATTRRTTKKAATGTSRGPQRCTATSKRTGERCRNKALPGSRFCAQHGGKPAATRRAASARPTAATAAPARDATVEPEPAVAAEPEPAVAAEPEPVAEAEPEAEVEIEPEPVVEAEPEAEVETDPEPAAEAEPEVEGEVAVESEPVAEAEPEAEVETEPVPVETVAAAVAVTEPARATVTAPAQPAIDAPVAGPRPARMTGTERLRQFGAAVLVIIGALCLMFASTGWWLERNFLDTDRFVRTADEVLDREEVKAALSTEIVRQINRSTGQNLDLIEPFVASIVGQVVDSSAFRRVFNAAVSTAHRALVDREVPEVTIDLQDTYNDIRSAVRAVSPRVAKDMPKDVNLDIDVIDTSQLEVVWDTIDLVEDIVFYLTIAAIVFLAGGLALAARRWRTLALAGWVAVGTFAFLLLALSIARRIVLGQIDITYRDAAGATWDVVLHGLELQTIVFLVVTGVLAVLAGWIGRHGGLPAIRDAVVRSYRWLRDTITARIPREPAPVPGAAVPAGASATTGGPGTVQQVGTSMGTVIARIRLPEPVENAQTRHVWRAVGLVAIAIFVFVWPHTLTTLLVIALGLLALYLAGTEAMAAAAMRRQPQSPQLQAPSAAGR